MLAKACETFEELVKSIDSQIKEEKQVVVYRTGKTKENQNPANAQELIVNLCKNSKHLKPTGLSVTWRIPVPSHHRFSVEKEGFNRFKNTLADRIKQLGFSLKGAEEASSNDASGRNSHEISIHFEKLAE
ncbi:MAG: hypothetical protein GWP59_07375 [Chlamydiales bacterium]|nr:hypothetical protein [Chlamydiales bacterium]NCF71504.1 hypothetical protein [Chlamydiales bacterium]